MDNKEAIVVLKSNYPHGRVMISEAVDLSIKTLEAAESQTAAVQQLKAEIAQVRRDLVYKFALDSSRSYLEDIIVKLGQLSAV